MPTYLAFWGKWSRTAAVAADFLADSIFEATPAAVAMDAEDRGLTEEIENRIIVCETLKQKLANLSDRRSSNWALAVDGTMAYLTDIL